MQWSIQNNELQILEELQTTGEEAILLTPETGLIGIPSKSTAKDKQGTIIQSLIMANELKPGRAVKVQSKNDNSIFKLLEVQFIGDTHGNTWTAKSLGKEIA